MKPVIPGLVIAVVMVARTHCALADWNAGLRDMDALFEKFASEHHAPGLVYGVVRDGSLVHVHGIGVQDLHSRAPITGNSVFRIASLTKSFTALAALSLRDQGRLDLDAAAVNLVPELALVSLAGYGPITPRQLISHTAGLVTDDPWADRQLDMSEQAFSDLLRQGLPLVHAPGESFEYSNTGYAVLGRVISNASGKPYQDYITQVLLRPLGMHATVWDTREVPAERHTTGYSWIDDHFEEQPALPDGAFAAMAGLNTSAKDFGAYVAWLLSAWNNQSTPVPDSISPATVREAGRAAVLSQVGLRRNGPDGKACPVAWQYGAGFYVVTDCELGTMLRHPGGLPGYGSQLLLLPDAGVAIFAFASVTYAPLSEPVIDAAIRLKRAGLLEVPEKAPSSALLSAAAAALRAYQAGDMNAAAEEFAPNVLLDQTAAQRNAALRRYREAVGDCTATVPSEVLHALAARFTLECDKGTLDAAILLYPTNPPKIQYLSLELPSAQATD
jgi:CubicO group peptidase (beta-lactamase class C family)